MAVFERERFADQEIVVDGNQYEACTFTNCVLVFEGGEPPLFERCTFRTIKIELRGAAARTTNYLNALFTSGMPDEVESVLVDIKTGMVDLPDIPAPCDAASNGDNFGRVGAYALVILVVVLWLFGMHVWGFIYQPNNTLNDGDFLRTEIDFDQVPALPASLAAQYDGLKDEQLANIELLQWENQMEGIAIIPVDQAMSILLEQGFPEATDTGVGLVPADIYEPVEGVTEPPERGGVDEMNDMDATDDADAPADDADAPADDADAPADEEDDADDSATDEGVS